MTSVFGGAIGRHTEDTGFVSSPRDVRDYFRGGLIWGRSKEKSIPSQRRAHGGSSQREGKQYIRQGEKSTRPQRPGAGKNLKVRSFTPRPLGGSRKLSQQDSITLGGGWGLCLEVGASLEETEGNHFN